MKRLLVLLLLVGAASAQMNRHRMATAASAAYMQTISGGGGGVSTSAGVIALFTSCSGVQYLGADGACHAASGGFAAPDGWVAGAGGMTAGTSSLANTVTRTCAGVTQCGLWSSSLAITGAAGKDVRLFQNCTGTLTGVAAVTDTWACFYDQMTYNVTGGTDTHVLHNIKRATFTTSVGAVMTAAVNNYSTCSLTNYNGTMGAFLCNHTEWDPTETGTGSITGTVSTYDASFLTTITGFATLPLNAVYTAGDPTAAGLATATTTVAYEVGTCATPGKFAICIPASGTYTNPIYVGSTNPSYFSGSLLSGTASTISGAFTAANTPFWGSCNSSQCVTGFSNGAGSWGTGLKDSTGGWSIRDFGNSIDVMTVAQADKHVDFTTSAEVFANANRAFVASTDFTTSGSGTALENITGLSFILPASAAENVSVSCNLVYHQNAANVAVAFGVKASVAPTQINGSAEMYTSTTAFTAGNLSGLTTTTATNIVSATPSAITTNWNVNLRFFIENPSTTASTITIATSTAVAADTVTVKRGSYCVLGG